MGPGVTFRRAAMESDVAAGSAVELHQLLCTFSASCIKARLTVRWFTSGREGTSETLGALGD